MRRTCLIVACFVLVGAVSAAAAPSPDNAVEAGVQLSYITYKEPDIMKETGFMYGIALSYTLRKELMTKFDGLLSFGQMTYVGALSSGTPLTVSGIDDTMFEIRAVFGPADPLNPSAIIPYFGLGYRYLYDGANKAPGGYRRESNYLYLPIGIERPANARTGWSMGFTLEYDLFLQGRQVSHLSDVDPGYNDIENRQTSGYGWRGSVRFVRAGRDTFVIEPFIKYWKIAESDVVPLTFYGAPTGFGMYEPNNNSTEYGIRCMLRF